MDTQKETDDILSLQQQVQELHERVEKLENSESHENKDFNKKLSNDVQKIVKNAKGPLKPEEFLNLLINDAFVKNKKEAFAVIRKYPNNIHEVKNQFSQVLENIESRIASRKTDNILDDKINKKIRKFIKIVEKELEKVKPKTQSTVDQFFEKNSDIVECKNNKTSSKVENAKLTGVCKQKNPAKEEEKGRRKRKARKEDEDYEREQITAMMKKRSKLNSPQESNVELNAQGPNPKLNRKKSNTEKKAVTFKPYREPSPIIISESSQSSHGGSSQSSLGGSSQSSLGGSFESDETFEDYSAELLTEIKKVTIETGKRSKQQNPRRKNKLPECNKNEETVLEKQLPLKKKKLR